MPDSPLALRMMAAKLAQLARASADPEEAGRLMTQARRYERLAGELERTEKPASPVEAEEKAKTPSDS
jgi:hypothetical protein